MLLRHLLTNTCNFSFSSLVILQVSVLHKSRAFTFDPKTLNLVLVVSDANLDIGLSMDILLRSSLLTHNTPETHELAHLLFLLPSSQHIITLFGINMHLLCLFGTDQANFCTLFLQSPCLIPHILYPV